jgi:proteasome assembly chaperone 3
LFGAAPSNRLSLLHSLYTSHIATLIWHEYPLSGGKPVVVGIALKLSSNRGDPESEATGVSEKERKTFLGVLEALRSLINRGNPNQAGISKQ